MGFFFIFEIKVIALHILNPWFVLNFEDTV